MVDGTASSAPDAHKPAARKTGYSNPAFRAMGLPALRLPSRNWMIFWSSLTLVISGIVYDKHQQKKVREKWCDLVAPLSQGTLRIDRKPRKITVFVAPPPNDYLDTSMFVWRRFVKPVLFAAGVDYEVFTEEKQGLIRFEVAQRVRDLRKELREYDARLKALEQEKRPWNKIKHTVFKVWPSNRGSQVQDDETEMLLAKKFKAEFDFRNVLGPFYQNRDVTAQISSEDALVANPVYAGGVIILGRGAYKEYVTGLCEGILGPLEPPKPAEMAVPDDTEPPVATSGNPEIESKDESKEQTTQPEETDNVLQPFITSDNYSSASFPSELSGVTVREPDTKIPAIFHQPILMLSIPHLVGFLNIPERIYRFYNRRTDAERYCRATASCVLQKIRPFESSDLKLGLEEEDDWPKKWVEQAKQRNSDWVKPLVADERVTKLLSVYDDEQVTK